jgi:hypothetical protein
MGSGNSKGPHISSKLKIDSKSSLSYHPIKHRDTNVEQRRLWRQKKWQKIEQEDEMQLQTNEKKRYRNPVTEMTTTL